IQESNDASINFDLQDIFAYQTSVNTMQVGIFGFRKCQTERTGECGGRLFVAVVGRLLVDSLPGRRIRRDFERSRLLATHFNATEMCNANA
ncbi:hypothetical protein, partial [Flagellimonas marinaquae]